MGIFSRLFKGGQDGGGGPADGDDDPPELAVGSAPVEQASEPTAPAPSPPSMPLSAQPLVAAAAGAAPTSDAWSWPPAPWEKRDREAAPPPSEPPPTPAAPKLPGVTFRAKREEAAMPREEIKPRDDKQLRDPTMVMSPPPAPVSTPSPALAPPPAPAPPPVAPPAAAAKPVRPTPAKPFKRAASVVPADPPPKRAHSDSISTAFEAMVSTAPQAAGVSNAADLAAVRGVFEQVAAIHVAQVRDVMLEVRYGDANLTWMEMTRPALKSLRAMAAQMELTELCTALDEFCAGVETVVGGGKLSDDGKTDLLRRYQRLVELIPQAFELDAERDRREPIIVEALLYQVDGVEKPTVDKLFAVGLARLDALLAANAGDIAAVSGIRPELAAAVVERFKDYRANAQTTVSAPNAQAEQRALHDLLITLSLQNDDFSRVSSSWTDEAKTRKRELRKQREQTFQRIRVVLARLGERDQLAKLDKQPFSERIATIDRYLSSQPKSRGGIDAKPES